MMTTTAIEVLYAPALYRRYDFTTQGPAVPVVRYADHCAAIEEKEQLRAAAVRRCDELLKQLERMALLLEADQCRNDFRPAAPFLQPRSPTRTSLASVAGRFQVLDAAERDIGREAVCVCCGKRRLIRPAMHVCLDCFNATEAERL